MMDSFCFHGRSLPYHHQPQETHHAREHPLVLHPYHSWQAATQFVLRYAPTIFISLGQYLLACASLVWASLCGMKRHQGSGTQRARNASERSHLPTIEVRRASSLSMIARQGQASSTSDSGRRRCESIPLIR